MSSILQWRMHAKKGEVSRSSFSHNVTLQQSYKSLQSGVEGKRRDSEREMMAFHYLATEPKSIAFLQVIFGSTSGSASAALPLQVILSLPMEPARRLRAGIAPFACSVASKRKAPLIEFGPEKAATLQTPEFEFMFPWKRCHENQTRVRVRISPSPNPPAPPLRPPPSFLHPFS
jgi:hypothetical protein